MTYLGDVTDSAADGVHELLPVDKVDVIRVVLIRDVARLLLNCVLHVRQLRRELDIVLDKLLQLRNMLRRRQLGRVEHWVVIDLAAKHVRPAALVAGSLTLVH